MGHQQPNPNALDNEEDNDKEQKANKNPEDEDTFVTGLAKKAFKAGSQQMLEIANSVKPTPDSENKNIFADALTAGIKLGVAATGEVALAVGAGTAIALDKIAQVLTPAHKAQGLGEEDSVSVNKKKAPGNDSLTVSPTPEKTEESTKTKTSTSDMETPTNTKGAVEKTEKAGKVGVSQFFKEAFKEQESRTLEKDGETYRPS
jgi:hypothetical protein